MSSNNDINNKNKKRNNKIYKLNKFNKTNKSNKSNKLIISDSNEQDNPNKRQCTNDFNKNSSNLPLITECKIEHYDENGNLKFREENNSDKIITSDNNNNQKTFTKSGYFPTNQIDKIFKIITLCEDNPELNLKTKHYNTLLNMSDLSEQQNNTRNYRVKVTKIDIASGNGKINILDEWLKMNLDSDNKFIGNSQDYTINSMDNASSYNKIQSLIWWLNANKTHGVELKYTENAINYASKFDYTNILTWWAETGLELKYDSNAVDNASSECKIKTLEWWLEAKTKYNLKFIHTSKSLDEIKIDEKKILQVVQWWKSAIDRDSSIEFKYTKEFINTLKCWNFEKVYNFMRDNKMLLNDEKFTNKFDPKLNFINMSESKNYNPFNNLGLSFGFGLEDLSERNDLHRLKGHNLLGKLGLSDEKVSSKYNLDELPEDIKNHIKKKEEELNNSNLLSNGRTKEYIDNLVKIPFGKYKIEKIFCFIESIINKLNSINSKSSNEYIKKYNIKNESDLIDFFDKTKYFSDNIYSKYAKIFEQFQEIKTKYMEYVDNIMEETVFGHKKIKKQIKCIISQWLSGGFKSGIVIGIQGPPGVGKTTLIKRALSNCLVDFIDYDLDLDEPFIKMIDYNNENKKDKRPFCFNSLGGTVHGSTLCGTNFTFNSATPGDIVKHLTESGIMNPILYFDELDKISKTQQGNEISSVLTHITDPVQNSHFTDRYFSEVKIDLSKCIIVFSYNDSDNVDKILLDRIQEIKLYPIKSKEKIIICKKFIIPEICSQLGYNLTDVEINDELLGSIIDEYTFEAGVRKLKEKINEIFRMNHLELIENPNNKISNKINISSQMINNVLGDYPKNDFKKINHINMVGCINGLYASASGIGGITPIQVKQIFSKENLSINITGSVEKIMEESVKVAKTVSWNLLNREEQDDVIKNWDSRGFHVHFPDGSTPKDGPSGGTAITCAIYSLLTNKPIKHDIAITGEIDLHGNVTKIGGLDIKLNAAKHAGVKTTLIPKGNFRELEIVIKNNPELFDENFKVFMIEHVREALTFVF